MLYRSTGRYVDGLWIGTWDDKPDPILGRIEEALVLIKRYDRVRYDHILRDLRRIWVILLPSSVGAFASRLEACEIDSRYLLAETTNLEMIASIIVHEATHARLLRLGLGYEEALRPRIEAICMRREIAFAAKLPNGEQIREQAKRSLSFYSGQEYWTNAAFRDRHIKGSVEALHYLGAPEWLIRSVLLVRYGISYMILGVRRLRYVLGAR